MSFYQNYIQQCNKKGVSPSKAAIDAGTTKTSVNRWKNGSLPTDATIAKLADYFGCAITDLIDEKKPAPTNEDGLTEAQREFIRLVPTLTDRELDVLLSTAKALIAARQ